MKNQIKVGDIVRVGGKVDPELVRRNAGRFRTVLDLQANSVHPEQGEMAKLDGGLYAFNCFDQIKEFDSFPVTGLIPLNPPGEDEAIDTTIDMPVEVVA